MNLTSFSGHGEIPTPHTAVELDQNRNSLQSSRGEEIVNGDTSLMYFCIVEMVIQALSEGAPGAIVLGSELSTTFLFFNSVVCLGPQSDRPKNTMKF